MTVPSGSLSEPSVSLPFVNFLMKPTKNISSTPTLIFGSQNTCLIQGIILASQMESPILVSFYLLREDIPPEGETPTGEGTEYPFVSNMRLEGKESMDWLSGKKEMILQSGDTLWAYSDNSNNLDNLFNTFVSYEELLA